MAKTATKVVFQRDLLTGGQVCLSKLTILHVPFTFPEKNQTSLFSGSKICQKAVPLTQTITQCGSLMQVIG